MVRALAAALALLGLSGGGVRADCEHFKWSVAREAALFKEAPEPIETGASAALDHAYAVTLKPTAEVVFPAPPERAPKAGAFGAALKLDAVDPAGLYDVTLSDEAWIDVVQGGVPVKSENFSGQKDCPGIRKSVRFNLAAGPAVVQVSNVGSAAITLAVVRAPGG